MARIEPRTFQTRDGRRMVVRCPEVEDAAAVRAFAEHITRNAEHIITQPDEVMTLEQEREWIAKGLRTHNSLTLLAVDGERIVGLLGFKGNDRRRTAHHGVFGISVHADERGAGIGTEMIRALLDWAAAHPDIEKVCLGVFETNPKAKALYERLGFVEECRRQREIRLGPGKYVNEIQMSLWVKPA